MTIRMQGGREMKKRKMSSLVLAAGFMMMSMAMWMVLDSGYVKAAEGNSKSSVSVIVYRLQHLR